MTPTTEAGKALLGAVLGGTLQLWAWDEEGQALIAAAFADVEAEARRAALEELRAVLEDHWPDIGQDQTDSTWLLCSCGWDQSRPKSGTWQDHLDAAIDRQLTP